MDASLRASVLTRWGGVPPALPLYRSGLTALVPGGAQIKATPRGMEIQCEQQDHTSCFQNSLQSYSNQKSVFQAQGWLYRPIK